MFLIIILVWRYEKVSPTMYCTTSNIRTTVFLNGIKVVPCNKGLLSVGGASLKPNNFPRKSVKLISGRLKKKLDYISETKITRQWTSLNEQVAYPSIPRCTQIPKNFNLSFPTTNYKICITINILFNQNISQKTS